MSYPIKKHLLDPPPLSELAELLNTGLKSNFKHVSSTVVTCPDLRLPPFNLAASGLSGSERIADIGGPPYLHPFPNFTKKYSLIDTIKAMELPQARGFVIGAGAGPFHIVGQNSELIPNLSYEGDEMRNLTHYAKIDEEGGCICGAVPGGSTDCAFMANLFGSEGNTGDVLKIVAKGRSGKLNFTEAIQALLKSEYGDRTISLGGVFLIKKGKVRMHVMPDFSTEPLTMREALQGWLRFFEMSSPMVCLSVFHSFDPGLGLRMEHTHCFSDHGEGGHYHGDTTPEEVEYEAYFNTARAVYRIDQPPAEN